MASLITCPHCGLRPKEEFSIRGDAGPARPAPDASFAAWDGYVHLRDNVRGVMDEHWQHVGGCRRWLVVTRDTFTHAVLGVVDAAEFSRARAGTAKRPGKAGAAKKQAKTLASGTPGTGKAGEPTAAATPAGRRGGGKP